MSRYTPYEFVDLHRRHQTVLLDTETGTVLGRVNTDGAIDQVYHGFIAAQAATALNLAPELAALRDRAAALRGGPGFPVEGAGQALLHSVSEAPDGTWRVAEPHPETPDLSTLVDFKERVAAQSVKAALDDLMLIHHDLHAILGYLESDQDIPGPLQAEAVDIGVAARHLLAAYWAPMITPVEVVMPSGKVVGAPPSPWLADLDRRFAALEDVRDAEMAPAPGPR